MAMKVFAKFASAAPVPIYPAAGSGAEAALDALSLDPRLALVSTPRHASILLVAGNLRDCDRDALRRIHDQLPVPRATLWWETEPLWDARGSQFVSADKDPTDSILKLHRALLCGESASEDDLQPDEPSQPWRGKGEHGQGGEGMMGGAPYGRPMAMTSLDIRDGLQLDSYTARFGPFLPALLPPGLSIEFTLQGDVVQAASVQSAPYSNREHAAAGYRLASNARSMTAQRLRLAARLLDLLDLRALAHRCRRLANQTTIKREAIKPLLTAARRAGAFAAIPPNLAEIAPGNNARARFRSFLGEGDPGAFHRHGRVLRLAELLPGLELGEVFLVINSFEPHLLMRMSPVKTDDQPHKGDEADEENE